MNGRFRAAEWVYAHVLLRAFPLGFRQRFGREMRADFRAALLARPDAQLRVLCSHSRTALGAGLSERWSALERWALWPTHRPHLYEPAGRHAMFWETLRADI